MGSRKKQVKRTPQEYHEAAVSHMNQVATRIMGVLEAKPNRGDINITLGIITKDLQYVKNIVHDLNIHTKEMRSVQYAPPVPLSAADREYHQATGLAPRPSPQLVQNDAGHWVRPSVPPSPHDMTLRITKLEERCDVNRDAVAASHRLLSARIDKLEGALSLFVSLANKVSKLEVEVYGPKPVNAEGRAKAAKKKRGMRGDSNI